MHFGAIAQSSRDCLPEFARLTRFGFWGTLGISSGRRVTVFGLPSHTECHWTNSRLIKLQKKTWYSFLWVVADLRSGGFSCCFNGKYHYHSTIFDILWKVVRAFKLCCSLVWETFRFRFFAMSVEFGTKGVACYVKCYHHHRLLQGVWSYKISPRWGCLHWSGLLLFGRCWTSSVANAYQTMKPCNGQYYRLKGSYELRSAIMLSV